MKRWSGVAVLLAAAGLGVGVWLWLRERRRHEAFSATEADALLNPARRLIQDPAKVIGAFGIMPGSVVLEIGPGPGYFTPEAARAVGSEGRVVCFDLQRPMLLALRRHLGEDAGRVDLVTGDAMRLPFRDGCIDHAYLISVAGEVPEPMQAVRETARVLRVGGVVSFSETVNDPDFVRMPALRRMCAEAGLVARDWRRQLLGHIARFERPA